MVTQIGLLRILCQASSALKDPQRILIVRLSHLGDVACTLGLLHSLRAAYPAARIAWAIQPEFAPLVAPLAGLERTILFERRGGLGSWFRMRRELKAFAADLAVDAQGNLKSAAVTWLSGAKRRVGMARADWQEKAGFRVLNDAVPNPPNSQTGHLVARLNGLAAHLLGKPDQILDRTPQSTPAEEAFGQRLLSEGWKPPSPPLVISLSTPGDVRSWPSAHWKDLLQALAARGQAVLVSYGPAEEALAEELELCQPPLENLRRWAPPMDLRSLAGLLTAASKAGSRFLGVDSGPMHLAWATGVPVTVLEGPFDASRTGPWPLAGGSHQVLRSPEALACAPCFKRKCSLPEGNLCMQGIKPDHVLSRLPQAREST